ncbi:unnamed protein product [Linum trigynum]|uniref:Uncharacterized protein n=1 Tax=Linum trigynum TaxID=586398 RepID=A0AAV2EN29_9ROSI
MSLLQELRRKLVPNAVLAAWPKAIGRMERIEATGAAQPASSRPSSLQPSQCRECSISSTQSFLCRIEGGMEGLGVGGKIIEWWERGLATATLTRSVRKKRGRR